MKHAAGRAARVPPLTLPCITEASATCRERVWYREQPQREMPGDLNRRGGLTKVTMTAGDRFSNRAFRSEPAGNGIIISGAQIKM